MPCNERVGLEHMARCFESCKRPRQAGGRRWLGLTPTSTSRARSRTIHVLVSRGDAFVAVWKFATWRYGICGMFGSTFPRLATSRAWSRHQRFTGAEHRASTWVVLSRSSAADSRWKRARPADSSSTPVHMNRGRDRLDRAMYPNEVQLIVHDIDDVNHRSRDRHVHQESRRSVRGLAGRGRRRSSAGWPCA